MMKKEFKVVLESQVGDGSISSREQSKDKGESNILRDVLEPIHVEILSRWKEA